MKEVLPVNDPLLNTYPEYGHLFSMLDLQSPSVWHWIYSNFIHLEGYQGGFSMFKNHGTLLRYCPFLQCYSVPRTLIDDKYSSIVAFIEYSINNNCYVLVELNRFYISATPQYQRYDMNHLTMIYGYDQENQIVYAADNLEDGTYRRAQYSMGELDAAYRNLIMRNVKQDYDVRVIERFTCPQYCFNVKFLTRELFLYLNPQFINTEEEFGFAEPYWYNQDVLRHGIEFIEQHEDFGIQTFHLLYEHKKLMESRVQFLIENEYILPDSELLDMSRILKENTLILRNLVLKYQLMRNHKTLANIKDATEKILLLESEVVTRLIDRLESSPAYQTFISAWR